MKNNNRQSAVKCVEELSDKYELKYTSLKNKVEEAIRIFLCYYLIQSC